MLLRRLNEDVRAQVFERRQVVVDEGRIEPPQGPQQAPGTCPPEAILYALPRQTIQVMEPDLTKHVPDERQIVLGELDLIVSLRGLRVERKYPVNPAQGFQQAHGLFGDKAATLDQVVMHPRHHFRQVHMVERPFANDDVELLCENHLLTIHYHRAQVSFDAGTPGQLGGLLRRGRRDVEADDTVVIFRQRDANRVNSAAEGQNPLADEPSQQSAEEILAVGSLGDELAPQMFLTGRTFDPVRLIPEGFLPGRSITHTGVVSSHVDGSRRELWHATSRTS